MDARESAPVSLRVYNTLTRKKEAFEPLDPVHVRFYVCGPTVYDNAHIGNARPVVVFDVLYRLLKRLYPKVTYVRNITDVDDKINARAQETGETIRAITERTAKVYHDDMAALGALPPDVEPRATDHIERMIEMIKCLIDSDHAYAEDGHVLFDVPSMPDYGRLSGRNRDEQIAGARVEVAPYKRDPADFVLWKPSSDDLPGWDSPWGRGRPGWHIECSAMSTQYLGETFDIHGGGQDLIFPHHENEIAQSCCATGEPFVRYWMHNGYLMVEGEKMSKSLGNFYTVHDLLDDFPGEAIRLTLLQTHYRQPLDFRRDDLMASKAKLDDFYGSLQSVADVPALPADPPPAFLAALSDDLNTPQALVELHALRGRLNTASGPEIVRLKGELLAAAALLGILDQDPLAWRRWRPAGASGLDDAAIEILIADREDARNRKDFAAADEIRARLTSDGVILEDGAGGTLWRRV
jgi:cysteinyl-tRNA synthetase